MSHLIGFFIGLITGVLVPGLLLCLALIPWRRLPEEPWTERARRLHPITQAHAALLLLLPFAVVVVVLRFFPGEPMLPPLVGVVLGGVLSGWPLSRSVFPGYGFEKWLRASAVFSALRLGWMFLVLFFALAMPSEWSVVQIAWVAAFLLASGVLSAGLIYQGMVMLRIVRAAGDRLTAIVRECAEEADVRMRSVWVVPTPSAFAAALVVQRDLIFSTTTEAEHDEEELRAICRHELAHLNEGRGLIMLRIAQTPLLLLPFIFVPSFINMMGGLGVLPPLLAWLLLQRLFQRMSVRLELRADAMAKGETDSPAYARALERLHRRNLQPAVLAPKASRTHPDLYDRMIAAGLAPEYPRPAPPSATHWLLIFTQVLSGATMLLWMSDAV